MKKLLYILYFLAFGFTSQAQDPDLYRLWFLTELNVNGTTLITTNYYPTLTISFFDDGTNSNFSIPFSSETCSYIITEFQEDPDAFLLPQDIAVCLLEKNCLSGPGSPCEITHDLHAEVFEDVPNSFLYTITANSDDTFALQIENSDGDTATYSSVLLNTNDFKQHNISIYPNPVNHELRIQNIGELPFKELIIYNIQGQAVHKTSEKKQTVDVSLLPSGIYFLEVSSENGRVVKKFVKK